MKWLPDLANFRRFLTKASRNSRNLRSETQPAHPMLIFQTLSPD